MQEQQWLQERQEHRPSHQKEFRSAQAQQELSPIRRLTVLRQLPVLREPHPSLVLVRMVRLPHCPRQERLAVLLEPGHRIVADHPSRPYRHPVWESGPSLLHQER